MSQQTLSTLVPDILLEIGDDLNNADLTCLSLTCKHHREIYAPPHCPRSTLWTIIAASESTINSIKAREQAREQELKQWDERNLLLPRLLDGSFASFSKTVSGTQQLTPKSQSRSSSGPRSQNWELCVGCTSLKIFKKGWRTGSDYGYTIITTSMLREWQIVSHNHNGNYCEACAHEWKAYLIEVELKPPIEVPGYHDK